MRKPGGGLTDLFSIGVFLKFSRYEDISMQAVEFARQLNLPATDDAHYLALALRENCKYWTADKKLWNIVKGKLIWVHWFSGDQI